MKTIKLISLFSVLFFLFQGCSPSLSDANKLASEGNYNKALEVSISHLDDGKPAVRLQALKLTTKFALKLGAKKMQTAGAKIMPLLQDEDSEAVQLEAIRSLGLLKYTAAAGELLAQVPTATGRRFDTLAQAFANLGVGVIDQVVAKYDEGANKTQYRAFLLQIGPEIAPSLIKSLGRKSKAQIAEKFEILIALKSNRVPALILPYVDDIELSDVVLEGLAKYGSKSVDAINALLAKRVNDADRAIGTRKLVELLGKLKNKRAIPTLEKLAKSESELVRAAAELALQKLRGF